MWYEILPTFAILVAGIAFTPICSVYMNKLVQKGNAYRRDIRTNRFDKGLLHRDTYLFKNPYTIQGLKNIPDEEGSGGDDDKSSGKKKDPCKC